MRKKKINKVNATYRHPVPLLFIFLWMSATSFSLGLSEKRNHRRPVYVFWHGLAAFFFSSVRSSNGDENPLRGKYGGTGAALWDVFSFFRPKYSSDHMTTTHTTGTRVGIHTCACSRVKGSLREHERACALNAWRAIRLILPSSHPSPPTFLQPILLPISPLAKWLHFHGAPGMWRFLPLLLPSLGLRWKTTSPLSSAISLDLSFDNLQHWWFIGSIVLLYSSEKGKKSR